MNLRLFVPPLARRSRVLHPGRELSNRATEVCPAQGPDVNPLSSSANLPDELKIPDPRSDRTLRLLEHFSALVERPVAPTAEGEPLPSRLAAATATVLEVTGAGISLMLDGTDRVGIGASDMLAAVAQRLQSTAGDGPCWVAQRCRRPVVAGPHEMADRWPAFSAELQARTPYRAVVAVPLINRLDGVGTVDLYLDSTDELHTLHIADTVAVADEIVHRLVGAGPAG